MVYLFADRGLSFCSSHLASLKLYVVLQTWWASYKLLVQLCVLRSRAIHRIFWPGSSKAYLPKKVPNIQRIINNVILKIVNIVFSVKGGSCLPCPPPPAVYGPVRIYSLLSITTSPEPLSGLVITISSRFFNWFNALTRALGGFGLARCM
jgi:hypothetical protein